jgi:hypothetical protein
MLLIKLIDSSELRWKKIYTEKTTAGTGIGIEQAQGHELWAHMFTNKLIDGS